MATENDIKDEELKDEEVPQGEAAEGEEQGAAEGGDEGDATLKNDSELNDAIDDEAREAIRARRRQERHDKKQAQREREESLRRELASRDAVINEMRERLDIIDRKSQGSEVAQVDDAIKKSAEAYHYYKGQIAAAVAAQNGQAVADAQEQMIIAQRKYEDFTAMKKALQQRSQAPQPLDPRLAANAKSFLERNSWYSPEADDQDSDIARTVDRRLAKEGWDPRTPQYWEELEKRLRGVLPHRYKRVYNTGDGARTNGSSRPSTVSGSGRESAPSGSGGGFTLSADQVQAIKDAGMWNDPAARERMVKRYKDQARASRQTN